MGGNDWSNGLFGCLGSSQNCKITLANYCCWPCIFGKLAGISGFGKCIGNGQTWAIIITLIVLGISTAEALSPAFWPLAIVGLLLGKAVIMLMMRLRGKVRSQLDINGNRCSDCLTSCCCWFCVMSQMSAEYDEEGLRPLDPFYYPERGDNIRVQIV